MAKSCARHGSAQFVMAFDAKFRNFGVIKISDDGYTVRVYCDKVNQTPIYVGSSGGGALSAMWAGEAVVVTLKDGRVRRYRDFTNWDTI